MMQGKVQDQKAQMPLSIVISGQPDTRIEFVVDTGFEGALTLPPQTVIALGLAKVQEIRAVLADGSRTRVIVHEVVIRWHDRTLGVAVLAMDSVPLLGTSLLAGSQFFVDFVEGGEVRIEARP